jgi:hypothetical protein
VKEVKLVFWTKSVFFADVSTGHVQKKTKTREKHSCTVGNKNLSNVLHFWKEHLISIQINFVKS